MTVQQNVDLTAFNTLRLSAFAEYLAQPESLEALLTLLQLPQFRSMKKTLIGEGSNVLIQGDIPGLVIRPLFKGMTFDTSDKNHVWVDVAAGENWDTLVRATLEAGFSGLENLSLIPGSVGAAPCQNIGAYGVELSDRLVSLQAVSIEDGSLHRFSCDECDFSYRDSRFKSREPGQWIIIGLRLRLDRNEHLQLHYADLRERLAAFSPDEQTALRLRQIVCDLRRSKLPDIQRLPNIGSFFKNPVVKNSQYQRLLEAYPDLIAHPLGDRWKLAAGWLIEKTGWKGRRQGALSMYEKHALVLVNHGGATSEQVKDFVAAIQASVDQCFSVRLEPEPVALP